MYDGQCRIQRALIEKKQMRVGRIYMYTTYRVLESNWSIQTTMLGTKKKDWMINYIDR